MACRQEMYDQPKVEPYEATATLTSGLSQQTPIEGTVARGELRADQHLYQGKIAGLFAEGFPFKLTADDLQRGRQRFNIYCSMCHGYGGAGDGIIVKHGLRAPPSIHVKRLREIEPGYLFDVITHGYATMGPYRDKIAPKDRWRIVGYLRALQRSQYATLEDIPLNERNHLSTP